MDFVFRCLDPEQAVNRNSFIHEKIAKYLNYKGIVCGSLSYVVDPLPAKWIEHAIDDLEFDEECLYHYKGKKLTFIQAIDMIKKYCFEVTVHIDDISVKRV